jgi:predicted transposase/invertase (TIGR01784 family)
MAKKYEELTFTDDFMFCKILEQNKKLCVELLELILGEKIGSLVEVNRQKPVEITADGGGVRFDVYAEDGTSVYDVEMQNYNQDSLPKRTRYSQGMIDLNLLEKGKRYKELNQSYIIYICKFNPFPGKELHKYTFINLCRENTAIELGDETAKIILCCEGNANDVSGNMKAFLRYIADGKPGDAFTNEIERAVTEAKEHKRWRQEYMTLLEQYEREREAGRAEGREEGREEGRAEERKNTERERRRADAAEAKIKELEKLLAEYK